jgi:hypothetical protein
MNGKQEELIIEHGHLGWDELPEAIRTQFESTPELLEAYNAGQWIRQLMALKRHEKPSEEVAGRMAYRIRTRLENSEPETAEVVEPSTWTWVKYAIGGLAVALIGLNIIYLVQKGDLNASQGGAAPLTNVEAPNLEGFAISATSETNETDKVNGSDAVPVRNNQP